MSGGEFKRWTAQKLSLPETDVKRRFGEQAVESRRKIPLHLQTHSISYSCPETLSAIANAVGDTRVVMLGEQSHGDGGAFAARAAIVEYLHLHHGFDVLSFEASFFSVTRGWEMLAGPEDVDRLLAGNVYPFWKVSEQLGPLWQLVKSRLSSERPLVVGGIDPRHTGSYSRAHLVAELEERIRDVHPRGLSSKGYLVHRI